MGAEAVDEEGMVAFHTLRGTSGWLAPEMLNQRDYGFPIDLFGIGLTVFRMLGGYAPFNPPSLCEAAVEYDDTCWCHISSPCKALISKLLSSNPLSRGTASEALEHEWIAGPPPADPKPEDLERIALSGALPNAGVRFCCVAGEGPLPRKSGSFVNFEATCSTSISSLESSELDEFVAPFAAQNFFSESHSDDIDCGEP